MKKTKIKMTKKSILNFLEKNATQFSAVMGMFLITAIVFNSTGIYYFANVLTGQKSAVFSGTTYPVKKSPNWVALSSAEWKYTYDQLPQDKLIDLPTYTPSELAIPFENLDLSTTSGKNIRNAQVTFSVPYMGNYKLDGKEYAGSHLAVDIKVPKGTPVYAIANAVVVKASSLSTGFGNHLVLRHDDVPAINNPNQKTTYYSGYAHLQSYSVAEGQLVEKGQLIGYSGDSGTGTTPHLHFQIDNDTAPWHPYWPYTSKEASDAGFSFYEAVNAGVGKDKAMSTTINPLIYIQQNLSSSSNTSSSTSVAPTTITPAVTTNTSSPIDTSADVVDELPPSNTDEITDPVNVSSQPLVDVTPVTPDLASIELKYTNSFRVGEEKSFKVIALDTNGEIISAFKPENDLYIKLENGSAKLSKTYLSSADFKNGVAEFSLTPSADFGIRVSVSAENISAVTDVLTATSFSDVAESDQGFVAINFLKNNDVVRGYPDGSFKPKSPVSRVESLKFIYEGLNKEVNPRVVLEFTDTDSKAWYARYIASAQQEGVVKGYPGNVFKPANSVTRAEFVKMLVEAAGYNAKGYQPLSGKNYDDVNNGDWYYSYIALAKDKNILDTSTNKFRPNEDMTREEVAEVLYKMIMVKVKGEKKYDRSVVVNAEDVANFYRSV